MKLYIVQYGSGIAPFSSLEKAERFILRQAQHLNPNAEIQYREFNNGSVRIASFPWRIGSKEAVTEMKILIEELDWYDES